MEYITANGTEYGCQTVTTGINMISFTMQGQEIASIEAAFKGVTELTVSGEDKVTYGNYEYLSFESATVYADGKVSVTMHIKDETEHRLDILEETQEIQDGAIEELAIMAAEEKVGE